MFGSAPHCGRFAAGAMGSELDDFDFYREGGLKGGRAHTPDSLRRIFSDLEEIELRRMHDEPPASPHFGEPFLWTALFRRGAGRQPERHRAPAPPQE